QCARMREARPTAINLRWAVERVEKAWQQGDRVATAKATAAAIIEEDVELCHAIGLHGLALIREIAARKPGTPVNILTHCNAGRMACIEWGTATAPVYLAHHEGIPVHVWVDETRPRNQGASITAWELGAAGVPHTLIADNTGGHLMQHGQVDLCIVGTDRTTREGDVANKIGTYLKALAAFDNQVPFYVALPSPSIDWSLRNGLREIPIEMRSPGEVTHIEGWNEAEGRIAQIRLAPEATQAANYGFDVTPARLITGLITERGICAASEKGLTTLFPEKK
ncbi:MAG: S-methyl-5-thioribose-1-phosphate isomerase, partial [Bacteroidetes bacterium]